MTFRFLCEGARKLRDLIKRGNVQYRLQHRASFGDALERLKARNLDIGSFVSIGAGSGDDTLKILSSLCPSAHLLMIEAQDTHLARLTAACSGIPNRRFQICVADKKDGSASFLASAPTGGALAEKSVGTLTLPARSIDSLISEFALPAPHFLKFDTHGVEMQILEGASQALKNTNLIMMECYNFKLNYVGGKNLKFHEMCVHLEKLGFRCVDMSDLLFRPNDFALWQMHIYFIRTDHPVFSSNSYSTS